MSMDESDKNVGELEAGAPAVEQPSGEAEAATPEPAANPEPDDVAAAGLGESEPPTGVEPADADPIGDLEAAPDSEAAPEPAPETGDAAFKPGQVSDDLKRIIEALIYASPDPLTPKTLFKVLESEPREDVQLSLESLQQDYAEGRGGLHLVEVAGGYQIVTRPELSEWVRRLFHERKSQKLSVQALETLAVIAYKQPITGPEIAEIRGVNTAGVIATLLERRLIKIAGRKQVVGRPFLYATTREFLIRFGLRDLNDLPKMEDMADVLGFEPPSGLAEAGPAETMLPLGGPDPDQTLAVEPDAPPGANDDDEPSGVS